MNDELLQLIYNRFDTEASFETFKADFGADEELRKLSYSKLDTEATYEDFISDVGYLEEAEEEPKKAIADSTESPSDSAQEPSSSDMLEEQETQEAVSESSSGETEELQPNEIMLELPVEEEPNEDIAQVYDAYKEAGKITPVQTKEIQEELASQKSGDRSIWEDIEAYGTGLLRTGALIPLYKYDTEEQLVEKRIEKNKVNFLSALPEEQVKELNEYAVNRTVELNARDTNILAENKVLEEKSKQIVRNLKLQEETIKKILEEGKEIPAEGIEAYSELYNELENIGVRYNNNIDIIESDQEDVGNFYEELDLLKKNYGGLDYYKDVTRLATADMIAGLMEFGISTEELMSPTGVPAPKPKARQFIKEFRGEVANQKEELRPQLSVNDIENPYEFMQWLGEQTATQLPILTVLAASGGTSGLTALGASAAGQKMGALVDETTEVNETRSRLGKEISEMKEIISQREQGEQGGVDGGMDSIRIEAEGTMPLEDMKKALKEKENQYKLAQEENTYDQLDIYLAGTAFGLAEALSERVSLGILSKGKRALSAINKSGLQKEAKAGFGSHFKNTVFAGAGEGSSEVGNQWAQNLVDIMYLDKKDVHIFDGTEDALASGFAMGAGMRLTPTLIGLGGKAFLDKTKRRKIIANTKKIERYMSELEDNPDISKEAKAFLQKKVDEVTKETQQDIVSTLAKLPEIGEEGIKKLINIDKKANGILSLIKEVEKTDLSDEVKQELKLEYKANIDKLIEEKENILNPESAQAIVKEKEDGVKQQEDTKEAEATTKEGVSETTAKEEGADKGGKGTKEVQGEDGAKPSVVDDGKGVQQDSVKPEGVNDGRTVDTVREELAVVEDKMLDYSEAVKDGVTADMDKGQYKKFRDEQKALIKQRNNLSNELSKLEKGKPKTIKGAKKYKTKNSAKLQEEVIAEFGVAKVGEAITELGFPFKEANGKRSIDLTREQLESVAEKLGFKDTDSNTTESKTEKKATKKEDFTKIDLSKESGLNKLIEILDNAESKVDEFGKENLSLGIPVVVAKAAIQAMKVAAKTAKTGADVLSAGINYIKGTDWYNKLSDKDKADTVKNFMKYVNNPTKEDTSLSLRENTVAKVDELLLQGKEDSEIIESFESHRQQMMAQDILEKRKPVDQKKAFEKAQKSYEKAKKEMHAKKSTLNFFKRGLRKMAKLYWDRQYLPKMLLKRAGGKLVRNYMITMKGASGFAKYSWDKAYEKIYKGLSSKDIEKLDQIILQMRFIAIDKNRAERGEDPVVHPDFQNRETSEATLREFRSRLGEKKFNDLTKRANAYFDAFRDLLDGMHDSGIVTKEFRDNFFDVNYQPRVFLKFLTDQEQEMSIIEMGGAAESASLGSKQLNSLSDGSSESLIVDSMYLLGRAMNTRAKSNAMNTTTRKLHEFMEKQAEKVEELKKKKNPSRKERNTIKYFEELSSRVRYNPIIGFTKPTKANPTGTPKYKYKKKSLEKAQTFYKDGVKHQLIMEEAFHDQYNDNLKGFISNSNRRERIVMLSGTALVKTIATGNNPAFFLTNSPRDFMFISTFSDEYGSIVPVNMIKLAMDTTRAVLSDMLNPSKKGRGRFEEFVKHGGMLDFLHTQGEFKGTTGIRKWIENTVDNRVKEKGKTLFNWITFNKLQMYSEIGFRMAVFNRSISNQLKELGLKDIEDAPKDVQQDIYTNATASARNTTDFSQGGIYTKDADALIPYLNAGVQGTRVAVEALAEKPASTMLKMAQSASILSAVPIAASLAMFGGEEDENFKYVSEAQRKTMEDDKKLTQTERYLKAMEGVSLYDKTNYQIYFTGDVDENGEYTFWRVSKPHFLTPLINYVNGVQEGVMKKNVGYDGATWGKDENAITKTMKSLTVDKEIMKNVMFAAEKNISPIELSVSGNVTRNPIIKASLTYMTGFDFYRRQDLSYLRGKVLEGVEGHESRAVEDFYKKIGEDQGISPARMKGAVESIITTPSTSPFVGILYGGLDVALSDKDARESMGGVKKSITKSLLGRVKKSTSEFNRREDWDKIYEKEFTKIQIQNLRDKKIMKDLARGIVAGEVTNEEVTREFERIAGEDTYEFKRMVNTFKATVENPDSNPIILDLKFRTPIQRAIILADIFGEDLLDVKAEIGKVNKDLRDELFTKDIMNEETIVKYQQIIDGMK